MQAQNKPGFASLLPRRFSRQVLLLTAIMVIASVFVLTSIQLAQLTNHQYKKSREMLVAIAANLSLGIASPIVTRDYGEIEQLLLRAANYPDIHSLEVLDTSGKIISKIQHQPGSPPKAVFDMATMTAPQVKSPQFSWNYGTSEHGNPLAFGLDATELTVWFPIENAELGWLHIKFSVDAVRGQAVEQIMTSIFFALAMLAIIVLLLSRLLKTATSALSEATDFARDLTNIRGQEIPFHHSSIEIEQLCLALNQTSLRLHIQETELANSNRLLGNVLSSSSKMAIIATDLNGCITVFNRGAELLLGYTADAMIAKESLLSFHLPAELQAREHELSASLGYAVQGLRAIVEIPELQGAEQREWIYVTKTGAQIPVALVITTMRSDDGRITGYLGIAQDITERLRNDRLKTQFISTVSHELRTPLTAVVGALGLVSGGALGAIPEKAQQMIRIAHKNSQRLTYLINDLLDIEKLAAGKMHFDMKSQALIPLIEQAIENNRTYSTDRQIKLILASTEGNPNVYVDTQRLQQILSNLISNAIKYSPDGGTVVIAVQTHENRVRVTVSDSGAGIPPEFYDRIFQKFSQADSSDTRQKGGTGLGLAITRELVERMGGDIGFSSTLGQGTSFYFDFPLQREHAACTVSAQEPDEKNGSRILIIEDEPDIAHLLSIILTRAGYVADIALNGTEALIALKQKQYAAVTLDLMLPDISGLEIIRQIRSRKETLDTPIIVVSAKMEEGRLAINSNFSHIDWLAKPIDDSRLLSILDKNLTGKNEHRLRVLHIEDDTDLHATILTMAGERFYFEFATTLNEARARMKQVHLDLVILDLKLPDGSGWELLPEIRAHYPHIRVVILTGNDIMPNDADKADAILLNSKISPDELLRELDKRILPAQQQ